MLFYPPNVSGWNDRAWLDTSRLYGRWYIANQVLAADEQQSADYTGSTETGSQALATAIAHLGNPVAHDRVARRAAGVRRPAEVRRRRPAGFRALRQNALRQLVATSPDYQVC